MKKEIFGSTILLVCLMAVGSFVTGCGGGTSTDTTTTTTTVATTTTTTTTSTSTTTTLADQLTVAKAVSVVGVGSAVGGNSSMMGGTSASALSSQAIKAFSGSAPPTFLYQYDIMNGPLSIEGYIPVTSETIGGSMNVAFRMKNNSGEVISGNLFANKKVAKIGSYSTYGVLMELMEGQPSLAFSSAFLGWVAACSSEGSAAFNNSSYFMQITSEGEYMCWATTYATMESALREHFSLPSWLHLTTPESSASDALGAIDNRMSFTGYVTGEINVVVDVDPTRSSPLPGTYEATSVLTFEGGTLQMTARLIFINPGNGVEFAGCLMSGIASPGGETFYANMNPDNLGGFGILSSEAGTIGTFEATQTGGNYYPVSGSKETFSF